MKFNHSLLFEQIKHSFFSSSGTPARLTPKRVGILILFFPIFFIIRIVNFVGLKLDNLFYQDFHHQKVSGPVFIIGNLRSGTTFLHRLMAKDKHNFTYMCMWEIIFAQSIFQRKFFWKLRDLDNFSGGCFQKLIARLESKTWFSNPIHKIGMTEPHEDEGLLVSIWESINTSIFFPHLNLVDDYALFDKKIPKPIRRRVMKFYEGCLKRHLYSRQVTHRKFLSKSPAFSPKVNTLLKKFPQSKIIYLVRNPLDVVPSMISWMSFQWEKYIDWPERYLYQDDLMELAKEWYEYPLTILDRTQKSRYVIIKYDDLVSNPQKTISMIYDKFGYEMSKEFKQILASVNKKQQNYRSTHTYSLSEMGLSKSKIIENFKSIIKRFEFDAP